MFKRSKRTSQLKTSPKLLGGNARQFDRYLQQAPRRKKIFNGSRRRKQQKYLSYILLATALIGLIVLGVYLAYY